MVRGTLLPLNGRAVPEQVLIPLQKTLSVSVFGAKNDNFAVFLACPTAPLNRLVQRLLSLVRRSVDVRLHLVNNGYFIV